MGCLRQVLKDSKVTVTTMIPERLKEKGLPTSLQLEMDIDPEKDLGEYVELQRGYAGYKYPEEICRWFSIAI